MESSQANQVIPAAQSAEESVEADWQQTGFRGPDHWRLSPRRLHGYLRPEQPVLPDLDAGRAIERVYAAHQAKSARVQSVLRLAYITLMTMDLALFPPREHVTAAIALAACYVVWGAVMLIGAWRNELGGWAAWSVLGVDLPVLTAILIVAGTFTDSKWSSPFSGDVYVLMPILASFQLRPRLTAITGAAATCTYALASGIGHSHAGPDLHYTLVHAVLIAVVSTAGVLLSWIQQSRVGMIADLAHHRSWLVANNVAAGERDRRQLSEALHDGPLQNVLVARQDIAEVPGCEALERADNALKATAAQLRSQVTELHPAVLEHGGLEQALHGLAERAGKRSGFAVKVRCDRRTLGSSMNELLYNCSRELIANIAKHAHATTVQIDLITLPDRVHLTIADNGVGIPDGSLHSKAAQGHIGLASQRIRISDAGGTLELRPNVPSGTLAEISVPFSGGASSEGL
ncbi:ATP-binding protein [Kitasatospora sp. NPDC048540]|uniref:sensor histidine kinase n=1 Tax=unclassified Kitasatospora TaxID=2633591 RepID=UPI00131435F6|nr:ATP-binding protein [Kitasatospora sp. MBT63]